MTKLSQKDLDALMRQALTKGEIKMTKEFARIHDVSKDRADSSLARVTRQGRKRKK